jgi:SHS2 domain-containing protein
MSSNREPPLELQRQIEDSITARNTNRNIASDLPTTASSSSHHRRTRNAVPEYGRSPAEGEAGISPLGSKFEYLDHPADIVLHSWGIDLREALENLARCMFGYMTRLDSILINEIQSSNHGTRLTAQGHDIKSLLYSYLDEWLFNFFDTGFIAKEIEITELRKEGDDWRIVSSGRGEIMDISRHPQGTEVKAITYSGMRVEEKQSRCDLYVVVDI